MIGDFDFGLDKPTLAAELREMADAIGNGTLIPSQTVRSVTNKADDWEACTFGFTFTRKLVK